MRKTRKESVIVFQREQNNNGKDVKEIVVCTGRHCPSKFFLLVNEAQRYNGTGNSRSYIRTHNNRYGAFNRNGSGCYQCHHNGGGGGTALNHGGNQQPDEQSGKRIGGGKNYGLRC